MKLYRDMLMIGLACTLAVTAAAVDEKVLERIGEMAGSRHALVVHVGAGAGEFAVSLAEKSGFVVHGLEPDGSAAEKAHEQILKAGCCGAVVVEQADVKILPYVNQLANVVVVDDWKRMSEAGLDPKEIVRVLAPYGIAFIGQSERFGSGVKDKDIKGWLKKADVEDVDVFKKDGIWVTFVKDRPEGMDVWTHKWHDETRNHASQDTVLDVPSAIHWINGTAYTWSMRQYRASAREVYYFLYNTGGLSRWGHRKKPTQTIEAYDAYSGVALWSREIPEASSGFTPIIADDRIIITSGKGENKQLMAISTQTGKDLLVYKEAGVPADGCVHNGVLIWMFAGGMKGVDVKTGRILWERKPSAEPKWERNRGAITGFQEYCIVAGDGMVFVADRASADGKSIKMRLIGLDVKSGEEKWSFEDPRLGDSYQKYFYYDGYLVLSLASGFLGVPVKGKGDVWEIPVTGFDKNGKKISSLRGGAGKSCFAFDGKVWIRGGSQFGMVLGEDADLHGLMPPKEWVAFDIKTGKRVREVGYDVPPPVCRTDFDSIREHLKAGPISDPVKAILVKQGLDLPANAELKVLSDGTLWRLEGKDKDENGKSREISMQVWKKDEELWFWNPQGWQQRCFPDLGCPAFIISSNNEWVDMETGEITQNRGLRGNCGEGPFFGNGLFYMTPHYCCFCFPMVRGGIAMSGQNPPATPVGDAQRLTKGPAYSDDGRQKTDDGKPEEWPGYRRTARRICGTTAKVATPLAEKPRWRQQFGDRITQAVAADGRAYVAVVNQGRVCAMDAESGKLLWDFAAGSRIDTPPTVYGGQLLFGCHDGFVYALRAEDGKLAWKFNAAPEGRRMIVRDRVESSWPVPGAILVADGTAYFIAGRITSCEGGMHMYALDAVSGAMKWHKNIKGSNHPKLRTGIDCWHEPQGELCNAILVKRDGELLLTDEHMYWRFSAETGEQIIPEKDSSLGLEVFSEKTPWVGMDRPTWMANFHGENFVPEIKFPYGNGTPCCYPAADRVGLIFKRLRKDRVMEMLPAKADDLYKAWEAGKFKYEFAWQPVKTKIDVHAYCVADDVVFIAGPDFDPKTDPATGTLAAISLKDGQDLGFNIKLAASPVYDGMSTAYGSVFVSLQDGTLMCLGK